MISINILQLSILYLLLLIVFAIFKKYKISQSKLLLIGCLRMTLQLTLAGFILTYIFNNPSPIFSLLYLVVMIFFAIWMVFSRNKGLSKRWKLSVLFSISTFGVIAALFFVGVIVRTNIFDPQYLIPLSGMLIGNILTGVSLGVKSYRENIQKQKLMLETLVNLGVDEKKITNPIVGSSLEMALLPTINSLMGMGIISLPGMMTGQILAGSSPNLAILYQISILLAICVFNSITVFATLYFGSKGTVSSLIRDNQY